MDILVTWLPCCLEARKESHQAADTISESYGGLSIEETFFPLGESHHEFGILVEHALRLLLLLLP